MPDLNWERGCGAHAIMCILREYAISTTCEQSKRSRSRYIRAHYDGRTVTIRCSDHANPTAVADFDIVQAAGSRRRKGVLVIGDVLAYFGLNPLPLLAEEIEQVKAAIALKEEKRRARKAAAEAAKKDWIDRGRRHAALGLSVTPFTCPMEWRGAFMEGYRQHA